MRVKNIGEESSESRATDGRGRSPVNVAANSSCHLGKAREAVRASQSWEKVIVKADAVLLSAINSASEVMGYMGNSAPGKMRGKRSTRHAQARVLEPRTVNRLIPASLVGGHCHCCRPSSMLMSKRTRVRKLVAWNNLQERHLDRLMQSHSQAPSIPHCFISKHEEALNDAAQSGHCLSMPNKRGRCCDCHFVKLWIQHGRGD